jgi:hypothetical protein
MINTFIITNKIQIKRHTGYPYSHFTHCTGCRTMAIPKPVCPTPNPDGTTTALAGRELTSDQPDESVILDRSVGGHIQIIMVKKI